jgi:cell division protein FtsW
MIHHGSDRILLFTVAGLIVFGLLMVFSTSGVLAAHTFESPPYFLARQGVWFLLGIAVMLASSIVPYRVLSSPLVAYTLILVSAALLVAALLGRDVHGAQRWIFFHGFSFQPSEFAKWALIGFIAYSVSSRGEALRTFQGYLVSLAALSMLLVLIGLQPDFGMVALLTLVAGAMFFLGGMPWRYVFSLGATAAAALAAFLFAAPYRVKRILTFLDPSPDPLGEGFQIRQSLLAIGSGGILGKGLGGSEQKLFFLPEPHTDFMYAIICEELGLWGGLAVLGAFLLILWRGLRTAWKAPDSLGMLLAAGFTVSIVAQALLHMGVTLNLLPTKGLPLPFLSYGGSSLVMNCAGIGVLLNVSSHTES